jgi:hypothetical protein
MVWIIFMSPIFGTRRHRHRFLTAGTDDLRIAKRSAVRDVWNAQFPS